MGQFSSDVISYHRPTLISVMVGHIKVAMDAVGRTINAANTDDAKMTNKICTQFCFGKGFPYAGTEYTSECYCGSSLATGGVKTAATECGMACGGDATQPCGGPGRLTLWKTSQVSGPSFNPGVNGWVSNGCYSEGTTGRALLQGVDSVPGAQMTVAKCTAACAAADAANTLAGMEYGGECYCGKEISNGAQPAPASKCGMLCNGNGTEYCGGPGALNMYSLGGALPTTVTSTSGGADRTTTPIGSRAACPAQPATVGAWSSYGCYTEASNRRALSDKTYADDAMTLASCAKFCADYTYFGIEYSRECYCGKELNTGSTKAPAADCSMVCSGSSCDLCGGGNRLSVYTRGGGPNGEPGGEPGSEPGGGGKPGGEPGGVDAGTTSSVSSASDAFATATEEPAATGLPPGWSAYGCWVDGVNGRILNKQLPDDPNLTLESCSKACSDQGFTIAGAEYSRQCFCGNSIVNGGVKAKSDTECNTACGGNPNQLCGGGGRMSILSMREPQVVAPPGVIPTVGQWEYQGCYQDSVNQQRTFFWQNFMNTDLTPKKCLDLCGSFGYMAAGLEYGKECYCGDPANIAVQGSKKVDDKQCNIPCAGNSSAYCGGGSLLTTYFWKGDPFYSWNFPAAGSPDAGSYEFLIGGVCVPLITSQAITGKVTFLEKWGTGPPNSTGAYELDLSQINDFKAAWRQMHVKTDIFCAGGLTLPDKAGRQINIGGWSGDSTYGVRLYAPDGSEGVPGKNDWEENAAVLKLQQGRWYPTAMIMANGSILVIGGEVGSNSAPVPTLEILPFTGTKPLYMDWLERTDPNNLYPYACVLPSGGIFVAYYNEARILDENNFSTIKTLPNIPGAVNDPMGGRTYPLEGTAVLLPQHAPYTDPLGILICGGSTNGASNALDNCVSTYPDSANPKWELERMPSQRVMTCMAPLPDGTYLILNGAHHGVAGFGLAKDPNLNALLYDPTKPLGSRITVMANTTVARLYHSEAITLLDGRVLVSGSDPQDGVNPEEYRVETFTPPYLKRGKPRPTFTLDNKDWAHGQQVAFSLGSAAQNGDIKVSLLGSVSSTHGNSMGARTLFPDVSCSGTSCTVTSPPGKYIAPPGWYQFFVLDGGVPGVGVFVRIGGDPAGLGNWPKGTGFNPPGV
ncbi:Galactose oxidase, beta-propeller [Metarhizium rileyi]|uniref:Galactose oxidase, beta-propeller n=1 Tax=Metarhizium rileyi (strain RCEF 4871) TaxID=1649241 RepID=A0A167DLN1_METRR|nr:Galactose oxidase, beta-propeller [Metarhizium rileyi RCEF 4871]